MTFSFKSTHKGLYGSAWEMICKHALGIANPDTVSPKGQPDFRFNRKCYDCKQNGSIILYNLQDKTYIQGSSRVIYATHIAAEIVDRWEDYDDDGNLAEYVTVSVDLPATEYHIVDRNAFVAFLLNNKLAKLNKKRGEINIQTLYNYSKQAWHGVKGKAVEAWLKENELIDDDGVSDLLSAFIG